MSIWTDGERDLSDAAKLVNEDTEVVTRYGPQPKKSFLRLQNEIEAAAADQREDIYENATPYTIGSFDTGFTYTALNQRGEFNGDQYVFLGGLEGLPHVVAELTDPTLSPELYAKANYNDAASVANANGGSVQDRFNLDDLGTIADMKAYNYTGLPENTPIKWGGYYIKGDGGGNTGLLKFGAHTEKQGVVISIDANTYIQADIEGKSLNIRQLGSVGDGVANDLEAFKVAASLPVHVELNKEDTYRLVISSEADTLQPVEGFYMNANWATITHESDDLLMMLVNSVGNVTVENANLVYKGAYPANNGSVTKYGVTYSSDAGFCGFIGMLGDTPNCSFKHFNVYGDTDSNKYDTVIRGFTGGRLGTVIDDFDISHYSNAFSDGLQSCEITNIRGTKRHNQSSAHYGPGHLCYAGLAGSEVKNITESGALLDNLNSDSGATIQAISLDKGLIENVKTTMDNVGALALKNTAKDFTIRKIHSESAADVDWQNRLFEIQTFLQSDASEGTVEDVRIIMPTGNLSAVGFQSGGGSVKFKNINIESANAGTPRTNPIARISTSLKGEYDITIDNQRSDDYVQISGSIDNECYFKMLNSSVNFVFDEQWGASRNNVVEAKVVSGNNSCGITWFDKNTEDSNTFINVVPTQYKRQLANVGNSSNTTLTITDNLYVPDTNSARHNTFLYYIDVVCSTIDASWFTAKRVALTTQGSSPVTAFQSDVYTLSEGAGSPNISVSYNVTTGDLTVTATRGAGSANLRDLYVSIENVNANGRFQDIV